MDSSSTAMIIESNNLKHSNGVGENQFHNLISPPPLFVLQEENEVEAEVEEEIELNVSTGQISIIDDQWGEAYDDEGNVYFYSFKTGESQYESPYAS